MTFFRHPEREFLSCLPICMGVPLFSKITWLSVVSRIGAATLGGYALAYACTAFLSVVLPLAKSEAVLIASMVAFVIYAAAILWAFAADSPIRAWFVLLIPTALFGSMTLFMT
ncbi:MAG: iron transporter [Nitrospirales bacterium]